MKNKLLIGNFDKESGISLVTIKNKYGEFTGIARLSEEDRDFPSMFKGCEYAETRAIIKFLEFKIKILKNEIKALKNCYKEMKQSYRFNEKSFEATHIRKKICQLTKDKETLEKEIEVTQQSLELSFKERDAAKKAKFNNDLKKGKKD